MVNSKSYTYKYHQAQRYHSDLRSGTSSAPFGGGRPLVPRFRDGDDAVRCVSSARDVEAVLEDVGEVVPPPAPVVEE